MLSQKSLGDFAGIVKCFYPMHTRIAICEAAFGTPTQDGDNGDTGSSDFVYSEEDQLALTKLIEDDQVMSQNAPDAVCLSFLRRGDLFDACNTRNDFQEKVKEVSAKASSTKVLAAALRKSIKEIQSMIKVRSGLRQVVT